MQSLTLARALVSKGFRVTVCCYYEFDNRMKEAFVQAGAEVVLMRLDRSRGLLALIRELKKLFKKIRPGIIHVQYMAPGFAPIVAARLALVKTVFATVHQPGRVHGIKVRFLLRTAARICTAFFCVSRAAETSWFGSSQVFDPEKGFEKGRRHFTIYNAVDVAAIQSVMETFDSGQLKKALGFTGCSVIGMVGRLREEKGQAVIIRAMPMVLKTAPNARLLIVGDGPDKENLQSMAAVLGVQDYICWTGEKDPSAVIPYYSIMDVAVAPSRFEGFGLVAAEAMAAGLPLVASNIDGLNEVVEHEKTGCLIPVGDSESLAARIITLISNPPMAEAMGNAGREMAKKLFSLERFAESVAGVYRQFS